MQVDTVGEAAVVVRRGAQAIFGDAAEIVVLRQPLDAVLSDGADQNCFSTSREERLSLR